MASDVTRTIPVSCKLSNLERDALEGIAAVEHLTLAIP
jgi:Xaa-Pro aminopeptidase